LTTIESPFALNFPKGKSTKVEEPNFLQIIKDDPDNPLNKFLKISDDYKGIYSFDKNQYRVIFEDNGSVNLEEVSRELTVHLGLKEQKDYYEIEKPFGPSNNRADLTGRIDEDICILIENKVALSTTSIDKLTSLNESAFGQMQHKYIPHIKKEGKSVELFAVTVLMDVLKILENPENFEKFYNIETAAKHKNGYSMFKNLGIYIETRHFIPSMQGYSSNIAFHFPSISVLVAGGEKIKTKNTLMMVTKSSPEGIKNIRNRISMTNSDKKNLVTSILSSLITAYHNNANKKQFIHGSKHKVFVYIKANTIRIKNLLKNIILVSTEGAMVDGQNSADAIRIILNTIDRIGNEKLTTKNSEKLERDIGKLIVKNKIINNLELASFVSFIDGIDFKIEVIETTKREEAIRIAIAQNTSVEVDKEYREMSSIQEEIVTLNNFTFSNLDYMLITPQLDISTFSKRSLERSMQYDEFTRRYYYISLLLAEQEKGNIAKSQLVTYTRDIGANKQKGITQLVNEFIQNEEEFSLNDIELKDVDDDIIVNESKLTGFKQYLELVKKNNFQDEFDSTEQSISKIDIELEKLNKKRQKLIHFRPTVKNTAEFTDIVTSIFEIKRIGLELASLSKYEHKNIEDFLTIRCFHKYNSWKIAIADIYTEAQYLVNYFDIIKEEYHNTAKYIRDKEGPFQLNDGTEISKDTVIEKFFGTRI